MPSGEVFFLLTIISMGDPSITRFAAQTLRDYGLLKFAKGDAYRTWKLSFLGIAVASLIYHPDRLSDFKRTDYALYGHEYSKLPRTISTGIFQRV